MDSTIRGRPERRNPGQSEMGEYRCDLARGETGDPGTAPTVSLDHAKELFLPKGARTTESRGGAGLNQRRHAADVIVVPVGRHDQLERLGGVAPQPFQVRKRRGSVVPIEKRVDDQPFAIARVDQNALPVPRAEHRNLDLGGMRGRPTPVPSAHTASPPIRDHVARRASSGAVDSGRRFARRFLAFRSLTSRIPSRDGTERRRAFGRGPPGRPPPFRWWRPRARLRSDRGAGRRTHPRG